MTIKPDLNGHIALVTGASRGIGAAIAIALAEAGAAVAVNYREQAGAADAVVAKIKSMGGRAIAVAADVSQAAAVAKMVDHVTSALGPGDILVNNAGKAIVRGIDDLTESDFDETIAVAPNPIVHDDLVFLSAGYGRGGALIQQVQQEGEIRAKAVYGWRQELANKHGGVILMENYLFGDSDDRGIPFCADLKTGRIVWRSRGSGQGSVAIAGPICFVGRARMQQLIAG